MSVTTRLARRQVQRAPGKIVAVLLATILSALAIMTTGSFIETMQRGLTVKLVAPISASDVIVYGPGHAELLPDVQAAPGVRAAEVLHETSMSSRSADGRSLTLYTYAIAAEPSLHWFDLADGALPTKDGEIALTPRSLEELGVVIGDTIPGTDLYSQTTTDYVITGTVTVPEGSDEGVLSAFVPNATLADSTVPSMILIATDGSPQAVADSLEAGFAAAQPDAEPNERPRAQVTSQYVQKMIDDLAGSTGFLATFFLAFVVIALIAAVMVIRNTYQVLLAQRLRQSGLLRLVGATGGQLRSAVLVESLIVSVVGALVGVVLGFLLGWAIAAWAGLAGGGPAFPVIWACAAIVATVLVTLYAASAPAAQAAKLPPVAALASSATTERLNARRSTARWIVGLCFALAGVAGIAAGAFLRMLLLVIPAGVLLAIGLVILVPLIVVVVMPGVSRLLSRRGPVSKVAGENLVRTARRSGTIVLAIAFGGSLVVAMLTAVATAGATLDDTLNRDYAADVIVSTADGAALADAQISTITGIDGVEEFAVVRTVTVALDSESAPVANVAELPSAWAQRLGIDNGGAQLLVAPDLLDADAGGPLAGVESLTVRGEGADLDLVLAGSSAANGLPVGDESEQPVLPAVVTAAAFAGLGGAPQATQLWIDIEPRTAAAVQTELQEFLNEQPNLVTGEALETRALFEQVAGFITAFVLAMLALTIVISAIGLASVVALSVAERRRELGLLRALGVHRGGLRAMVFIESLVLALFGAALSLVIGIPLGIAAASAATVGSTTVVVDLPWIGLASVVLVAVLLGIVAAIGPAQRASRIAPAEALAHE